MMEPGTILAGRYRAGRTLGSGGMGVILEGTHVELNTPVAIKVLHDHLALDPERVERFLREARAAAQLRGEHVCRVHDVGTLPGGGPFMVMELLEGCDLARLLEQLGPLSPEMVIAYALQAAQGIAEAHARGLVHRDLKPTNIFRTRRPDGAPLIKILDFGLAKPINGQDLSLTQTANVVGSPRYMSPEQLKSSRVVDPRCDIWALGVVMYELLAGKPPFMSQTITELAIEITNEPPPPLPDTVPPPLADVVMHCLEKNPAKRYQSMAELAAALEACSGNPKPVETPEPIAEATIVETAPPEPPDASPPSTEPDLIKPHGARMKWLALGAGVVLAVIALVVMLSHGTKRRPLPAIDAGIVTPIDATQEVTAPPLDAAPAIEAPADAPAELAVPVDAAPERTTHKHGHGKLDLSKSRY